MKSQFGDQENNKQKDDIDQVREDLKLLRIRDGEQQANDIEIWKGIIEIKAMINLQRISQKKKLN